MLLNNNVALEVEKRRFKYETLVFFFLLLLPLPLSLPLLLMLLSPSTSFLLCFFPQLVLLFGFSFLLLFLICFSPLFLLLFVLSYLCSFFLLLGMARVVLWRRTLRIPIRLASVLRLAKTLVRLHPAHLLFNFDKISPRRCTD